MNEKERPLRLRTHKTSSKPIVEWFGKCACGKESFVQVSDWPENPYPCNDCYKSLDAKRAEKRHGGTKTGEIIT